MRKFEFETHQVFMFKVEAHPRFHVVGQEVWASSLSQHIQVFMSPMRKFGHDVSPSFHEEV
jgi:hypothetical protein